MGTAFLYGNGGSGGKGASLTVTAPAGCTVTVRKDVTSKTKVAGSDGIVVFKGLQSGTWTLTITKGSETANKTVEIVADYATSITFFAATINVTYPAGSTCTATDGTTTLTAPDTSGTWECVVPNAGTWTVSLDIGLFETVSITTNGQTVTIDKWYLYKSGTWSGTKIQKNGGSASCVDNGTSYSFNSSKVNDSYYYFGVECDLTAFKTLNARFESASGGHVGMFITDSATPNYLSLYDGRDTVAYRLGCVKGVNSISINNLSGKKFVWFGVYGDETISTGTVSEFYLS